MSLEVSVQAAASGGLRIIEHIPPARPCRLEGRNGIGKSTLVRVLVLLSGEQPYRNDPRAWQSLKKLIGPSTIQIDGLAGEWSHASITLTPELWPDTPNRDISDWIGVLQLDGQIHPASRLFPLLDVIHLSGTEGLQHTLEHELAHVAADLSETMARLGALESERATLGELADLLEAVSPTAALAEEQRGAELARERRAVQDEVDAVTPRVDDLNRAAALHALVNTGDAAERAKELAGLRGELDEARAQLQDAESSHESATAALAAGNALQKQVATAERSLRLASNRSDALSARQSELFTRLEAIGATPETEALSPEQRAALDSHRASSQSRLAAERSRLARARRSKAENDLLDDLRVLLTAATDRGLGHVVVARLNGIDIRVQDLRETLGQTGAMEDGDAEDARRLADDVSEWDEVAGLFETRVDLAKQRTSLEETLLKLKSKVVGHDELREAAETARLVLDEASARVRALNMRIGAANRTSLGGVDVEDASSLLDDLLIRNKESVDSLPVALFDAQTQLNQLREKADRLREESEGLATSAARRRVQREKVRSQASSEESMRWISALAKSVLSDLSGSTRHVPGIDWPDEVWLAIANRAIFARAALNDLVRDVEGLANTAATNATSGQYAVAVRSIVEEEVVKELSTRPIAEALFDGGSVLRVSYDEQSVTWVTSSKEVRTRPLSVFSSGEQALGFMRARLEQIAEVPAPNRIVFLDEFGAFIAADRRKPLAELLRSEELAELSEQVVVVLPLQADYADELSQTNGALHELYERRAKAVSEHGYFAEEFTR